MSTIEISRLLRQVLTGAIPVVMVCLLISAAQSLSQTASSPEERRAESEELRREGRRFFGEWQQTKGSTYLHQAIESYRKAIQTDSTYYRPYESLSYPLNAIGDKKGAIAACEKSVELLGENKSTVIAWLGRLYYETGQREKALEAFRKQILLDPSSSLFYTDTKYYIEKCYFTPEEIEGVLSLSEKHPSHVPLLMKEPLEVLERCAAAYKSLRGYRDTTTMEMHMVRQGMDNRMSATVLFAFERPDRLRIESKNALMGMGVALFSDGTKLVRYNEMWKQYTQKDAPEVLSPADLGDPMAGPAEDMFVPMIVTSSNPLKELLVGVEEAKEVGSEELDGIPVTVVELKKRAGSFLGSDPMLKKDVLIGLRLWLGSEDLLIRQVAYELDMGKMADESMPEQQRAMFKGMKISFKFKHSAMETDPVFTDGDFTFTPPEEAELVERFSPPGRTESKVSELVGKPAPDFTLKDLDGNEVKLADFKGKVLIVDFWATWCPPCVKGIPEFCELYEEYKEKGLVIVGISVDQGGTEVVKKFAAKHEVPYPMVMADQHVTGNYGGIQGIPTTFIVDREGRIVDSVVGYREKSYFEKQINKLLVSAHAEEQ